MQLCRLGTRGSALALAQSELTRQTLAQRWPDWQFELVIIKTTGDLDQKTPLAAMGSMGVFVKELELALLDGSIDLAIHSLKDVPDASPQGLELVSYFYREDPRDALISRHGSLAALPQGAKVGTGSPRRVAQLRRLRPDLEFCELRGNIDTRIARALEGDLDAVILAAAGLNRLGRADVVAQYLSVQECLPAIAQGIVALEGRVDRPEIATLAQGIQDPLARTAALLERGLMTRLGGGCKVPMAALAQPVEGEEWVLEALLADPSGQKIERVEARGLAEELVERVAADLEERCLAAGIPLPRDLPEHHLLRDRE